MCSWLSGWAGTVLGEAGAGTGSPVCVSPAGSQTWMQPPWTLVSGSGRGSA